MLFTYPISSKSIYPLAGVMPNHKLLFLIDNSGLATKMKHLEKHMLQHMQQFES